MKLSTEWRIYINLKNIYLKTGIVPIKWKNFIAKVINDKENLYNRPDGFIQHCCEKHLCNFESCKR